MIQHQFWLAKSSLQADVSEFACRNSERHVEKKVIVLGSAFLKVVMAGGASSYINWCYLQHYLPCSRADMQSVEWPWLHTGSWKYCGGVTDIGPVGHSAFSAQLSKCMPSSSSYQDLATVPRGLIFSRKFTQRCICTETCSESLTGSAVSDHMILA